MDALQLFVIVAGFIIMVWTIVYEVFLKPIGKLASWSWKWLLIIGTAGYGFMRWRKKRKKK